MDGVFSIGRVQTPTLFLIYQRQQEIENFVKKPFFELYGHFANQKGNYIGKYKKRFDSADELEAFKDENQLKDDIEAIITDVKKKKNVHTHPNYLVYPIYNPKQINALI